MKLFKLFVVVALWFGFVPLLHAAATVSPQIGYLSGVSTTDGTTTVYHAVGQNAGVYSSGNTVVVPSLLGLALLSGASVSYHANDATAGDPPGVQTKIQGEPLILATNSGNLVRTGYTFAGWNTQADGLGVDYAAGANYETDASMTLYAKWFGYAGGVGSAANPYQIADWHHLYNIRDNLDAFFVLNNDLNESSTGYANYVRNDGNLVNEGNGWIPIGNATTKFTGQFDGAGFTISNLGIRRNLEDNIGLFGFVESAVIKNIGLVAVDVVGKDQVGGLIGQISGASTVSNTYAAGNVSGMEKVGGLIGWSNSADTTITNVYAAVGVQGLLDSSGGLVGHNVGMITNSYSVGAVSGGANRGGLVGQNSGTVGNTNFWNTTVNDGLTSAGGVGKTTTELKTPATFTDAGWSMAFTDSTTYTGSPYPGLRMATDGAVWQLTAYEVTYSAIGASGGTAPDAQAKGHDIALTLAANSGNLVHSGHAFVGWNTAADGSGTVYFEGMSYTANAALELFAKWIYVANSGTGTVNDPYVLTLDADLANIRNHPDKHFVLDPNGNGTSGTFIAPESWTPIGSTATPFTGSIKGVGGNDVVIQGLDGKPLFDVIGAGAEISDISIAGNVITNATGPAGIFANLIAGADGEGNLVKLTNIRVDADSSITGGTEPVQNNIGGLAGTISWAELTDITIEATVIGSGENTGGIAGTLTNSSASNCTISGNVTGNTNVGGIAGTMTDSSASNCTITGNVTGTGDNVGGIGGAMTDSNATGCTINGDVTGNDNVGGVGGTLTGGEVKDIAISGEISANGSNVGLLSGPGVDPGVSPTNTVWAVTTSITSGGSISPLNRLVHDGTQGAFILTPATNYDIAPVEGTCGGDLDEETGGTYTTNAVTADCTVVAAFTTTVPNTYSFTAQTNVPRNSQRTSNTITVSGINAPSPISITSCTGMSCEYAINGGDWTATAGTVVNGNSVQVRQTSSGNYSTQTNLTLDIGGVTGIFRVSTVAAPSPVNAVCGSADGQAFISAPTSGLCSSGTASSVSGVGPWSWTCQGSNGGSNASCSAQIQAYTVTANSGEGGSISPSSINVTHGSSTTFTVSPDVGYGIDSVSGCGGTLSGSTYTTGAITGECTVSALFRAAENEYTLTVISGFGSGEYRVGQKVAIEANQPAPDRIFDRWTGDVTHLENVNNPTTVVTIPEGHVTVTATYKDKPLEKFTLSVGSGTGSGEYAAGYSVRIAADPPEDDKIFAFWIGQTGHIANVNNPNTTVTMPAENISIQAVYMDKPAEKFSLSVGSGTGGGEYQAGQTVSISANPPADNTLIFDSWSGQTTHLVNISDPNTFVIMPEDNVSVTAVYRNREDERFILTVTSGTGSGDFEPGHVASIAASPAEQGMVFDQWVGTVSGVANIYNPNTTLNMPGRDITVRATYKDDPGLEDPRELKVNYGTGSGNYLPGRVVSIAAELREGFIFDRWVGQTSHATNLNIPNTTLNMPDSDVTVTATFKPDPEAEFRLILRSSMPAAQRQASMLARSETRESDASTIHLVPAGRLVNLVAPPAPAGYAFDKWIGQTSHVDNIHQPRTLVYMPDNDMDITATYRLLVNVVLTVENGTGSGSYQAGDLVSITADPPAANMMFDKWEGQTAGVVNINRASTTIAVPGTDVRIRAVYRETPDDAYPLYVVSGAGSGDYQAAQEVDIRSGSAPAGQMFTRWSGQIATVMDVNQQNTTLYMHPHEVTVVAMFDFFHTITAIAGEGGNISPEGDVDVIENERTNFTITADTGYEIGEVTGCSGSLSGDVYTTGPITGACTVEATFTTTIPDAYSFTAQTNVPPNAQRTSNIITVSGINAPSPISIASCTGMSCEYAINGSWWDGIGTVVNGATVLVRQTSSDSYATRTDLTLNIGGMTATFSVTTSATPHELTIIGSDGMAIKTTATSWLPGSTTTIEIDADGRELVVTEATSEDGGVYRIETNADGHTTHSVTPPGCVAPDCRPTVATSSIPGAHTEIDQDGHVVTRVVSVENGVEVRTVVETGPDGRGETRFEAFNSLAGNWEDHAHTLDRTIFGNLFDSGHQVIIERSDAGLQIKVITPVGTILYF